MLILSKFTLLVTDAKKIRHSISYSNLYVIYVFFRLDVLLYMNPYDLLLSTFNKDNNCSSLMAYVKISATYSKRNSLE